MLRSASLVDFQSHQNTEIEFGPFTVIVGSSSSGKSALVRGLRLVAENARGVSYVRQGAKACRVSIRVAGRSDLPAEGSSDSMVVSVERGKSASVYELSASETREPVVFTKCASSVPDPVSEALGLGDSSLWLAGQFDRPFLLDETGTEVARVLGRLTNVTMIYAAVRELNRRAAELKRGSTSADQELAEVRNSIAKYAGLATRLAAGQEAEKALSCAEELSVRRSTLFNRIGDVEGALGRAQTARGDLREVPSVDRLTSIYDLRNRLKTNLVSLTETKKRCSVELRLVPDTKKLTSLLKLRGKLQESLDDLNDSISRKSKLSDSLNEACTLYDDTKKQFSEALRNAGKCPLCGSLSVHAQVDHVL